MNPKGKDIPHTQRITTPNPLSAQLTDVTVCPQLSRTEIVPSVELDPEPDHPNRSHAWRASLNTKENEILARLLRYVAPA